MEKRSSGKMCDSWKKVKLNEDDQSYADSKYAEIALCQMSRFFYDRKFTDFELVSCDDIQ